MATLQERLASLLSKEDDPRKNESVYPLDHIDLLMGVVKPDLSPELRRACLGTLLRKEMITWTQLGYVLDNECYPEELKAVVAEFRSKNEVLLREIEGKEVRNI